MDDVTRRIAEVIERYDVRPELAAAAAQQVMVELAEHFGATRQTDGAPVAVIPVEAKREEPSLPPRPEREEGESDKDYGRRCDRWSEQIQNARKDAAMALSDPMAKATAVWSA